MEPNQRKEPYKHLFQGTPEDIRNQVRYVIEAGVIIAETKYLIKIPSAYRPSVNSKMERIASCWGKKCCRISFLL